MEENLGMAWRWQDSQESNACGVVLDSCAKAFRAAESFQVVNGLLLITATFLEDMPTTSCNLAAMACGLQLLISISET